MKRTKSLSHLVLAFALLVALATSASAYIDVRWNADGTSSITGQGGVLARNFGDLPPRSADFSTGGNDGGLNVWQINDNSAMAYMKTYFTGPYGPGWPSGWGPSSSGGSFFAKVKYISGDVTGGQVGFSWGWKNWGVTLGIGNGTVKFFDTNGGAIGPAAWTGDNSGYRVYAICQEYTKTRWQAWMSNGNDWSSNPADWTCITGAATSYYSYGPAFVDENNLKPAALLVGNYEPFASMWQGNVQYVAHATMVNAFGFRGPVSWDFVNAPWQYNPGPDVPEPGSLLALGFGLFSTVGFVIRRKRA